MQIGNVVVAVEAVAGIEIENGTRKVGRSDADVVAVIVVVAAVADLHSIHVLVGGKR
jgi:2C-methyl-D-erythritol 2,4-cyclodiphosphate synthase